MEDMCVIPHGSPHRIGEKVVKVDADQESGVLTLHLEADPTMTMGKTIIILASDDVLALFAN